MREIRRIIADMVYDRLDEMEARVRIPNADLAIIAIEKLRDYLLDPEHPAGGSKAVLLITMGYQRSDPMRLEGDLRDQHLTREFESTNADEYGTRYEIHASMLTPKGRSVTFRSIWQIDTGTDRPRLITLYPD
jgi:hypothetical protein